MSRDGGLTDFIPTEDWELNVLLLKVSQGLSAEDLAKFKFLCAGRNGIPGGVLERMTTAEKLFSYLRQKRMISRDNLLLLQAFLWHVERPDLHQMAADFARRVGDTLYFYAPQPQPEEGFQHVRFHVAGGLERFKRTELEALRAQVSRLLFVPPEFVFLSGVEPDQAVTLTFMVHQNCQAPLPDLLQDHGDRFSSLGVDRVWAQGKEVLLPGSLPFVMESTVEKQLCELLEKNQRLSEQVASQETTMMQRQDEMQSMYEQTANLQRRESYFRSLVAHASDNARSTSPAPIAVSSEDGSTHFIV
ncbi:uncharacterized protein [Littorina saxatilis]|uniref:DED domain-containing protein n=1 Tax=Littorina saxatilis TaxID=31220 RepID=A0AAN9BFM0_9CAEN